MAELGLKVPAEHMVEGSHTMERWHRGHGAIDRATRAAHGRHVLERYDRHRCTARALSHHARVPEDISVVGFDDIHLAQFMLPPLTTVQMSCRDLAAAAVEGLARGHRD